MAQRVLIVDDTEVNLVLLAALIHKMPEVDAISFSQPEEGLCWAQANDPDLVLVDYMMPALDGIEFICRLRATPGKADLPILMITANDQKSVCYRALAVGATDFLSKPIDQFEFMARVKNMLALSASQKKLADRSEWLRQEVSKATQEIMAREQETVFRLSKAAEYRDPETGAHILRMAHYSKLIAKGLGMSEQEQALLLEAAPMHDIGKVGISDHILLKPERLNLQEFEQMKMHALYGYDILKGSTSNVLRAGAVIARGHHERFDGTGYPDGLKGQEIPVFCRIVAVADVFDALTSDRSYKKAWTLERASSYLRENTGTHFDPACVDAFFAQWGEVLEVHQRFQDDAGQNMDATN